jgi:ATP-dependent HslUV protease ATP-binding subunit HslU
VDKVNLAFDEKAISAIAHAAYIINENKEDIGARRLLAVFEKLLEDVSYHAGGDDMPEVSLNITEEYVLEHLRKEESAYDAKRFIL